MPLAAVGAAITLGEIDDALPDHSDTRTKLSAIIDDMLTYGLISIESGSTHMRIGSAD